MQYSQWLIAALALGICTIPAQVMAQSQNLQTKPLTMADALAAERHSQDSLSRLASEMGQQVRRQENSNLSDFTESLNIPVVNDLLNGLLDDSGDLRLPMGLTVYDAMGTTSIGFGSRF